MSSKITDGGAAGTLRARTGTNLYRLGVPDKVIQAILRHSNVNVTLDYYIKAQDLDVIAAMDKFKQEIAAHEGKPIGH